MLQEVDVTLPFSKVYFAHTSVSALKSPAMRRTVDNLATNKIKSNNRKWERNGTV